MLTVRGQKKTRGKEFEGRTSTYTEPHTIDRLLGAFSTYSVTIQPNTTTWENRTWIYVQKKNRTVLHSLTKEPEERSHPNRTEQSINYVRDVSRGLS